MKKFIIATFLLCILQTAHATLIHYSLGGTLRFADTNFNNIYTADIFGDMYVSDIPSINDLDSDNSLYTWDIVSYAINADDKGWGGSGYMTTYERSLETRIGLDTPTGYVIETGHADRNAIGWNDPYHLPDEVHWPAAGWYFGDQYFAQILSLDMMRASEPSTVTEPPSIALLGIAMVVLAMSRRKVKA